MPEVRSFVLDGEPFAWKRPAQGRHPRTGAPIRITNKDAEAHKKRLAQAAIERWGPRPPFFGAVKLLVIATFAIPSSFPKALQEAARRGELYLDRDPDFDNIIKQVADALRFIAFVDDNQVGDGRSILRYGEAPRTECWASELGPDGLQTPAERRRRAAWAAGQYDAAIAKAPCGTARWPRVLDALQKSSAWKPEGQLL